MAHTTTVGSRIRSIRESKNITAEQAAERAGLTPGQLERIEGDLNLPSLAPLVRIARALGVRLGTFLDDSDSLGPVLCRREDRSESISFSSETACSHNNLTFFSLAQSKAGRHMEPFVIDIESESDCGYPLSTHEGEEFLYVLDGAIEVYYGKDRYVVRAGESIYYDSIVEHNVHAAGDSRARILAVVYTPF
ncbi:MAG: helix-turn-helix transcriptional regulator [Acidobacteria bacterium]|nr:helix-turn-helix transcriptional regulator [Acidobacteriota bacterium]